MLVEMGSVVVVTYTTDTHQWARHLSNLEAWLQIQRATVSVSLKIQSRLPTVWECAAIPYQERLTAA